MRRPITVTTDVDVDVYLEDFSDSDLIEELKERGFSAVPKVSHALITIEIANLGQESRIKDLLSEHDIKFDYFHDKVT